MKKILLALEETEFAAELFDFTHELSNGQACLVTVLLIPKVRYADLWSFGGSVAGLPLNEVMPDNPAVVEAVKKKIAEKCQRLGLSYRIHQAPVDFSLPDLLLETRFADLMLVSARKFGSFLSVPDPGHFLRELIASSECPVLLLPDHPVLPKEIILAYDGHASSIFSFEEFANLFPSLAKLPTILVYASEHTSVRLPDEDYLEEFVPQHYKQLEITKLHLDSGKQFAHWLQEHPQAFLVTGAFGRSAISQLLRKSYVSEVIAAEKLPLFIAHR